MLLLPSLKGTLFLFWIVTSYLMCAQIKTEKFSLPKYFRSMKKLEIEKKKWSTTCFNIHSWGANGKSFSKRGERGKEKTSKKMVARS